MSHLKYSIYEGFGEVAKRDFWYSQSVRVGGWDRESGVVYKDIGSQVSQAFENVDVNLKNAGGKGWEQVFRVTSYHIPLNDEALDLMVTNFKRWMPDHQPLWTCVGVSRLGSDDMRVEIEVVAHDPQ